MVPFCKISNFSTPILNVNPQILSHIPSFRKALALRTAFQVTVSKPLQIYSLAFLVPKYIAFHLAVLKYLMFEWARLIKPSRLPWMAALYSPFTTLPIFVSSMLFIFSDFIFISIEDNVHCQASWQSLQKPARSTSTRQFPIDSYFFEICQVSPYAVSCLHCYGIVPIFHLECHKKSRQILKIIHNIYTFTGFNPT